MAAQVTWWEINAKDPQALQNFYAGAFGWTYEFGQNMPAYGMVSRADENGIGGAVGQANLDQPSPHGAVFYIGVADPQAALDKVVSLGGRVVMPVTTMPGVTFGLFADPDGNVVGLVKSTPPPPKPARKKPARKPAARSRRAPAKKAKKAPRKRRK